MALLQRPGGGGGMSLEISKQVWPVPQDDSGLPYASMPAFFQRNLEWMVHGTAIPHDVAALPLSCHDVIPLTTHFSSKWDWWRQS